MIISINLPEEVESALAEQARARGLDVASLVQEIVTEQVSESCESKRPRRSHEEFMNNLQKIIDLTPASTGHVDDSRESIYEDR